MTTHNLNSPKADLPPRLAAPRPACSPSSFAIFSSRSLLALLLGLLLPTGILRGEKEYVSEEVGTVSFMGSTDLTLLAYDRVTYLISEIATDDKGRQNKAMAELSSYPQRYLKGDSSQFVGKTVEVIRALLERSMDIDAPGVLNRRTLLLSATRNMIDRIEEEGAFAYDAKYLMWDLWKACGAGDKSWYVRLVQKYSKMYWGLELDDALKEKP